MIKQELKKIYTQGLGLVSIKETKYYCSRWENLHSEI